MMGTSAPQRLRLQLVAAEFLERMGQRIRERRDELGYSRSDVARLMPGKTNENAVYRWEKGQHQPNPDTLQALAKALGCDVAYFMSEPPEKMNAPDLFAVNGDGDRLEQIVATLAEIQDQLNRLEAAGVVRDAEVLKQIASLTQPTRATRRGPSR